MMMLLQGCVTEVPSVPEDPAVQPNVAIGRVVALLTGERGRIYEPAVKSFEIESRETQRRYTVEIQSDSKQFIVPLAPGDFELVRVQISEGPFLSIAQLGSTFSVSRDPVTYLGTWRFGIDSPKYGRMVSLSMVDDQEDCVEVLDMLAQKDPLVDLGVIATALPNPPEIRTRLYEVMPYPRVPRYFRRHWW